MATRVVEAFTAGALTGREQWSNATQAGDPAAGYVKTDGAGGVLTQRALTAAESAQLAAQDTANTTAGNQSTLQSRAQAALAANATFQGRARPTATMTLAQQQQLWDQVQLLTKECNALIRLTLGLLDDTTGT